MSGRGIGLLIFLLGIACFRETAPAQISPPPVPEYQTLYPAKYKVDGVPTSTVNEFLARVNEAWPESASEARVVEKITVKDKLYPGLIIETKGKMQGQVIRQKLSYIRAHDVVYQLKLVDAEHCRSGEVIREGKWTLVEICEKTYMPLAKEFADLVLLADAPVDLGRLSKNWGKKVTLNDSPVESDKNQSPERALITIADMRRIMESRKFEWAESADLWRGYDGKSSPAPLVIFRVTGLDRKGKKLDQSFGYVRENGKLILKTIKGSSCEYNSTIKKDLCVDAFTPSGEAPFPLILLDSEELTVAADFNPIGPQEPEGITRPAIDPKFSCGRIQSNFEMALRMHFEKGSLRAQNIQEYIEATARLEKSVDPEGLFVDGAGNASSRASPSRAEAQELKKQLALGSKGDCQWLEARVRDLQREILSHSPDVKVVLEGGRAANAHQKKLEEKVQTVADELNQVYSPAAALDVARGRLERYFKQALSRASNYEETMIRAMAHLDAYSDLLEVPPSSVTEDPSQLFGLSVDYGMQHRYLNDVHPAVVKQSGLARGLRILTVRGRNADALSPEEFDRELLKTTEPLVLTVQTESGAKRFELVARRLNVSEAMFKIVGHPQDDERATALEVRIRSFVPGLAEALNKQLKGRLKRSPHVDVIVLNLKDNPGGNVDEAFGVGSQFVSGTTLAYYRLGQRGLSSVAVKSIQNEAKYFLSDTLPLVILVNQQTRSSSEILTSSLQELGRAMVIGRPTFGKFVAQSFMPAPLSDGRQMILMVTSTEYFSPLGKSHNGRGLVPDVLLPGEEMPQFQDGNGAGKDYVPSAAKVRYYRHRSNFDLKWLESEAAKSLGIKAY